MSLDGANERIDLTGQVAIVTGGGRGIGRAIAQALAAAGAAVAVVSRTREEVEETARLIVEAGGRAEAMPADVTDGPAIEELVAGVLRPDSGGATAYAAAADVIARAGRRLPQTLKVSETCRVLGREGAMNRSLRTSGAVVG